MCKLYALLVFIDLRHCCLCCCIKSKRSFSWIVRLECRRTIYYLILISTLSYTNWLLNTFLIDYLYFLMGVLVPFKLAASKPVSGLFWDRWRWEVFLLSWSEPCFGLNKTVVHLLVRGGLEATKVYWRRPRRYCHCAHSILAHGNAWYFLILWKLFVQTINSAVQGWRCDSDITLKCNAVQRFAVG